MQGRYKLLIGCALIVWLVCQPSGATESEFQNLSASELKQLLDAGQPVFLLNPLPSLLFRQGHIPGSVNIRWHALAASPLLPKDKHTPIITYCMGAR